MKISPNPWCCGAVELAGVVYPCYNSDRELAVFEAVLRKAEVDAKKSKAGLLTFIANNRQYTAFTAPIFKKLGWRVASCATNPNMSHITRIYLLVKSLSPIPLKEEYAVR